jgi:hypothetical protein
LDTLKTKYINSNSIDEKVKILTLTPEHWSIDKVASEFDTGKYIVRQARQLLHTKGVLGERNIKYGKGKRIPDDVKTSIVAFYERDLTWEKRFCKC